jgi:methyl-accepting chemotaxis protein
VIESVEHIRGALREQSRAMENASGFLVRISRRTQTHADTSAALVRATSDLLERANVLRESLSHFRV